MIDVYWFSCWHRYLGHLVVGLYYVVFGGDGEDCVHFFVCLWGFLGIVVTYDNGCGRGVGRGVFFGGHSCLCIFFVVDVWFRG